MTCLPTEVGLGNLIWTVSGPSEPENTRAGVRESVFTNFEGNSVLHFFRTTHLTDRSVVAPWKCHVVESFEGRSLQWVGMMMPGLEPWKTSYVHDITTFEIVEFRVRSADFISVDSQKNIVYRGVAAHLRGKRPTLTAKEDTLMLRRNSNNLLKLSL